MKTIATILATAAITAGTLSTPAVAAVTEPFLRGAVSDMVTRPCPQEDSINCYWNAGSSGNGEGHSFYSVRVGNKMCTIYTARKYNRKHGNCSRL
jgi:hypothetical protein